MEIGESETAAELHDRLALAGADLIVDTVAQIEAGTAQPKVQDTSRATRAPKLSRADSRVDWTQAAFQMARRINGLWSWPAATCVFQAADGATERLQLARAAVVDEGQSPSDEFAPGAFRPDSTVQAGRGTVRLLEVKPAGGKLMPFDAFARGRSTEPPACLLPFDDQ